jgi:hypothetical protein
MVAFGGRMVVVSFCLAWYFFIVKQTVTLTKGENVETKTIKDESLDFIGMLCVSNTDAAILVDKKIDSLMLVWQLQDEKIIDTDGVRRAAQILLREVEYAQ